MKIVSPLRVKCKKCGFSFEMEDEMECVSTYERNMGTEYEYEAVCTMSCPECDEDVFAKISAWEYPEGAVNHTDLFTDGVEIIENPNFEC